MNPPSIPLNVPLIGSRPPPEAIQEHVEKLQAMESLWPIHPFPMSGNGVRVPAYWMGQTLLDAFALEAMRQLDWRNRDAAGLETQCRRAWTIASMMLSTRPVGQAASDDAASPPKQEVE